jgi:monoterpene epsilon-lactone hydrolase
MMPMRLTVGWGLAGFTSLAVAGDSAGGGLALVTAARLTHAAREGQVPRPFAVCVMSPRIDLTLTSDSIEARAKHDPVMSAMLHLFKHQHSNRETT